MRFRTFVAACLTSAVLIMAMVGSASAHSILINSNPASGAKLATAPTSVQMTFSEGVEPAFSTFAVIDRTRKSYAAGAPVIDRVKGLVTVPLQASLPAGDYIVQWKVVSVVDGHLTRGSFAFDLLNGSGATTSATTAPTPAASGSTTAEPTEEPLASLPDNTTAETAGESTAPGLLDVAVRWLDTLLAACLVGGALFNLLILPGATAELPDGRDAIMDVRKRLQGRYVFGAIITALLLLVTLGAELILQAMRATESDLGTVLSQQGLLGAVLSSSFGSSLEWRALAVAAALVVLVAAIVTRRVGRWLWALLLVIGAGYFWAQTSSAHATALSQEPGAGILQVSAPLANLVHLFTTAIWIGGIFYFVVILLPILRALIPKNRAVVLHESIVRFSQIALVTVPIIALSGTVIYLAEQPSVDSTLNTDYGHDVLIKVGLLALLMFPAAYNLRRVGPGLAALRDKLGPAFQAVARGFRRSVRIEALLLSTVLIFSALLTLLAPATDPSAYAGEGLQAGIPADVAVALTPGAGQRVVSPTAALPEATATTPPPSMLTLTQTVRGVQVSLAVVHSFVEDDLAVTLKDANGPIKACAATPEANADCAFNVKVTLTELDDNATNSADAPDAGNGTFAVPEGPYMPLDGTWQVVVTVRRYNQPEDIQAAFRYDLEGASMTGKVSDYVNVDAATNPDPPRSGQVDLTFKLTDNNGQPVNDASISVQGIMPAHGHVTEVKQMSNSAGTYTTSLLMPMSGGWSVELSISRPGHDTVVAEVALDLASSSYDLTPYPSPNAPSAAP